MLERPTQQRRTVKSQPKLYLFFSMVLRRGLSIEMCWSVLKFGVVGWLEMKGVFVVMEAGNCGGSSGIGGISYLCSSQ